MAGTTTLRTLAGHHQGAAADVEWTAADEAKVAAHLERDLKLFKRLAETRGCALERHHGSHHLHLRTGWGRLTRRP